MCRLKRKIHLSVLLVFTLFALQGCDAFMESFAAAAEAHAARERQYQSNGLNSRPVQLQPLQHRPGYNGPTLSNTIIRNSHGETFMWDSDEGEYVRTPHHD